MDKAMYIRDLKVMIDADMGHLKTAVERGDTVQAHRFVNAIIGNYRELKAIDQETRDRIGR